MRRRVVVAAKVDPALLQLLRADGRLEVVEKLADNEDDLAAAARNADVLVTRTHNRVTRRVLEESRLTLIAQGTSGIDNIDLDAARELGTAVIHLPGINANAVAELVIGFIISMTRTIPLYTRQMTSGVWQRDDCTSRHELRRYRLGLVGLGHVGTRVARLASHFSMEVEAFDPCIATQEFAARGAIRCGSLRDLLASSDIVSMHVPLTDETRKMISADEIRIMRRGSYLINAARGEVVDQDAVLEALRTGYLAGVALDVFEREPVDSPLPDDPRLVLTPHIAGCSAECRTASAEQLYAKIAAFFVDS